MASLKLNPKDITSWLSNHQIQELPKIWDELNISKKKFHWDTFSECLRVIQNHINKLSGEEQKQHEETIQTFWYKGIDHISNVKPYFDQSKYWFRSDICEVAPYASAEFFKKLYTISKHAHSGHSSGITDNHYYIYSKSWKWDKPYHDSKVKDFINEFYNYKYSGKEYDFLKFKNALFNEYSNNGFKIFESISTLFTISGIDRSEKEQQLVLSLINKDNISLLNYNSNEFIGSTFYSISNIVDKIFENKIYTPSEKWSAFYDLHHTINPYLNDNQKNLLIVRYNEAILKSNNKLFYETLTEKEMSFHQKILITAYITNIKQASSVEEKSKILNLIQDNFVGDLDPLNFKEIFKKCPFDKLSELIKAIDFNGWNVSNSLSSNDTEWFDLWINKGNTSLKQIDSGIDFNIQNN